MPKTKRKSNKGLFSKNLVRLVAAASIIGCTVFVFSIEKDCAEKKQEMNDIQAKIDAYEAQNSELRDVLESDDISDYLERVALEERGYAYPDERRFYDTSRD